MPLPDKIKCVLCVNPDPSNVIGSPHHADNPHGQTDMCSALGCVPCGFRTYPDCETDCKHWDKCQGDFCNETENFCPKSPVRDVKGSDLLLTDTYAETNNVDSLVKHIKHLESRLLKSERESASRGKTIEHLQFTLNEKNKALDALHYVWCAGGCETGVHRYADVPGGLTEEIVSRAEKLVKNMRIWLDTVTYRRARDK